MIKYYTDLIQGSEEWIAARCGLLTASEMHLIMTPTGKQAANDKQRAHLYELAAQTITGHVEPHYISDDMLRGIDEEIEARKLYSQHYAPVQECGFITRTFEDGLKIGYSPDGIVSYDGLIECKSRRARFQIETICLDRVPKEHVLQLQTGLLVSGREWHDFTSYSAGLPLYVKRVWPDYEMHDAILAAARAFETAKAELIEYYRNISAGMIPTERKAIEEITL